MLAKRIIPCLDCDLGVRQGRVVKGVKFKQIRYAGIPWELAEEYDRQGADELIFLDITASHERRETMAKVIEKTSENVFMPLTVGGGTLEHILEVFKKTNASAALAASIFHFGEYTVFDVKEYLKKNGVHVRI